MSEVGYTTTDELARILKIREPSDAQEAALVRILTTAQVEIDSEIDLDDDTTLTNEQLQLAASVQLDRGADLWRHTESVAGMTGLLGDGGEYTANPGRYIRYSWERYAQRLAPLKDQWGIA